MSGRFNGSLARLAKIFAVLIPTLALAALLIQQGRFIQRADTTNANVEMILYELQQLKLQEMRNEMQIQAIGEKVYSHETWSNLQRDKIEERMRRLERGGG